MNLSFNARQELANSLSHGFGFLFGIISLPILLILAAQNGHIAGLVGAAIYGFSFLMLFGFSTLYHSFQQPALKSIFQKIDHISIYFLIAGTYTPLILMYLFNGVGIALLVGLWSLVVFGTIFKLFFTGRFEKLSLFIYLAMGWSLVLVAKPFFANMSAGVLALLATGGGLYTLGVVFYRWEKLPYHHAIWHLFVLAAGICHYVSVLLALS